MNEQLEARLEKYRAIKKTIEECDNGYKIKGHLENYSVIQEKIDNHLVVKMKYGRNGTENLAILENEEEAKNKCYKKLLSYVYRNFNFMEGEIVEDTVFPCKSEDGDAKTYIVTLPSIVGPIVRENAMARYRNKRAIKQNPQLRPKKPETKTPVTLPIKTENKSIFSKLMRKVLE